MKLSAGSKRLQQKKQTMKELVLLTVAFQWIWEQIENQTTESDRKSRDYTLSRHICNQLAYRIKTYNSLQHETKDLWKDTKSATEEKHNPFLAGLAMLAVHMEVKNKKVIVGLDSEIVELQGLCFEFFSNEDIDGAAKWAERIRQELKLNYKAE